MNERENQLEKISLFEKLKNIFHIQKYTKEDVKNNLNTDEPVGKKTKEEWLTAMREKYKRNGISIKTIERVNQKMIRGEKTPSLPPHLKIHLTQEKINAAYKKTNEDLAKDPEWQAYEAAWQKQMDELIKNSNQNKE